MNFLDRLNKVTNEMAEELQVIHRAMEGRGVSPKDSPIVIARLRNIEEKLRQLGSNSSNPIPF